MLTRIKALFIKPKREKSLMRHFSEEYLESLVNEHKLLQACLNRINAKPALYNQNGALQAVSDMAIRQLLVDKIILEVKIDELRDFLRG